MSLSFVNTAKQKLKPNPNHFNLTARIQHFIVGLNYSFYNHFLIPLNHFSHCYIFNDLLDHTILSYQDIIDIEDIWIDVVLRVQNFQVLPSL